MAISPRLDDPVYFQVRTGSPSMLYLEPQPTPIELWLTGGYRLLWCQAAPPWMELHHNEQRLTICCSLWKPGWGLHSHQSVWELRLTPGAEVVVWAHDVASSRARGRSDIQDNILHGDRYCRLRHASLLCRNPHQLETARRGLRKRVRQPRTSFVDPVNEVWVKWNSIEFQRPILLVSEARINGVVNTHAFTQLKILTPGKADPDGGWKPRPPAKLRPPRV